MIYSIQYKGREIARVTGKLVHVQKVKPGSLMNTEMVDDDSLLKSVDENDQRTLFLLMLTRGVTAEKVE